jgi:hypothetical protein
MRFDWEQFAAGRAERANLLLDAVDEAAKAT